MSILRYNSMVEGTAVADTATASYDPDASEMAVILGVVASYSAEVASYKEIVVSYTDPGGTARTVSLTWNFANGLANIPFPAPVATKLGSAVTADLPSGGGGITGNIYLCLGLVA